MNRRGFLIQGGAVMAAKPLVTFAQPAEGPQVVCVVLTDVGPQASAPHLMAVTEVFGALGLPVTWVVQTDDDMQQATDPDHPLTQVLSYAAVAGPSVSLAPLVPDLASQSGYFQARRLRDARHKLFARSGHPPSSQSSVAAFAPTAAPRAPTGARSAAVTTVIEVPRHSAPVRSERWPDGVVRLFGGQRVDLAQYAGGGLADPSSDTQAVLYLSVSDWGSVPISALADRAHAFASDLLAQERSGRHTVQQVSELQLRDNYAFTRKVAVHLVRPSETDEASWSGHTAMLDLLSDQGIPASIGAHAAPFLPDRAADYWVAVGSAPSGSDLVEVTRQARAGHVTPILAHETPIQPGHSLALADVHSQPPGFDANGVLWVTAVDIGTPQGAFDIFAGVDQTQDVLVSIRSEALEPTYARTALIQQMREVATDGVTTFVSLHEMVQTLAPKGPEITRQRHTIAAASRTRPRPRRATDTDRANLMQDAKIAWQYFEDNTVSETGLCPATVNFSPQDGWVHETVTMWDVGSHINALVAARQLGLIDHGRFETNLALILQQIRGRRTQGRLLPQGWIRVDRQKWGNANFDGSDAGRLLSALDNLRRFRGPEPALEDLVASWDLDQIVLEGEVHSVTQGDLHSVYRSHSAHYAARAFRRWGIDVASPYEVAAPFSTYDDQMALLEQITWIGPLGAEPLLLEALEQGMSAESDYLADVLFAAQIEDNEETGRYIAVSEGPIDVSPWFTYQGLQIDAEKRTWALDTVGDQPQYADPAFWQDTLVISCKAAFLWAAVRPHDYSDRLLAHVRAKARTERGYASSIFSKSGRVTETYTDLNTNAVILQSVAHILRHGVQ